MKRYPLRGGPADGVLLSFDTPPLLIWLAKDHTVTTKGCKGMARYKAMTRVGESGISFYYIFEGYEP